MDRTITLPALNGSLQMTVDAKDWCRVTLSPDVPLGADQMQIVAQRLASVLEESLPKATHSLDGKSYTCFIMLFENHTSGYARRENSELILHFRNDEGHPMGDLRLDANLCETWKRTLSGLFQSV